MTRQTFSMCDFMLAISTMPMVVGLLVMKSISDAVIGISQASEEIFRGDRLPTLNFHSIDLESSHTDSSTIRHHSQGQ